MHTAFQRSIIASVALVIVTLGCTTVAGALANQTAAVPGVTGVDVNTTTHVIYATEATQNKLAVISPTTAHVTSTVTVGTRPIGVAVDSATNTIYVLNQTSNTVSVVNGVTNTVSATITGLPAYVSAIAVNPTTDRIFVSAGAYVGASNPGSLTVINGVTNAIVATYGTAINPIAVAVNTNTNMIYVANSTPQTLTVLNGATGAVVANTSLGTGVTPTGVAVDTTSGVVYVATSAGVVVMNPSSNTVTTTVSVGSALDGIAVDHKHGLVLVNSSTLKNVWSIHEATNTVGANVIGSALSAGLAVDSTQGAIYDANPTYGSVSFFTESQLFTPAAPAAPTLTSQNQGLTVSWVAPSDLGPAITYYHVVLSTNPAGPFTGATSVASTCYKPVAAPALSCTLAGLSNGTKYYVEVAAANAAGLGAYSTAGSGTPATPPAVVPATMAAPSVKAGKGSVTATWHAASSQTGPVSQYHLTTSTGAVMCHTTALSCCFTAAKGKKFRLSVAAMNVAGWSKASPLSAVVTVV